MALQSQEFKMAERESNMGESFTKRIRSRSNKLLKSNPTIVEEENDFPFESIDFIRVGAAHTEAKPHDESDHVDLFARLVHHTMRIFQPYDPLSKIEIENK